MCGGSPGRSDCVGAGSVPVFEGQTRWTVEIMAVMALTVIVFSTGLGMALAAVNVLGLVSRRVVRRPQGQRRTA